MPHDFTSHDLLHALLDDFFVSFNINRSEENRTARPRRVVALPAPLRGGTVIPGVRSGARVLFDKSEKKILRVTVSDKTMVYDAKNGF